MFRPRFTFDQLRTFVAIVDARSMTEAATRLGLTQGALTQQLQGLERALGIALFERTGRGVRLTSAGSAVAARTRAALDALRRVEEEAQSVGSLRTGRLRIGASQTPASHYVYPPLAAFMAAHPGVAVEMSVGITSGIVRDVEAGDLDCGIVEEPLPAGRRRRLRRLWLADDEVVLVAHREHPLSALPQVSPDDLSRHRLLAREPGAAIEVVARELLGKAYARLDRLELSTLDAVRAAARAGLGFAVLPRVTVADLVQRGELREVAYKGLQRSIVCVRRAEHGTPALEALWERLEEQGRPIP